MTPLMQHGLEMLVIGILMGVCAGALIGFAISEWKFQRAKRRRKW